MKKSFLKGELPLIFGGAAVSGEGGGYGFGAISENEAIDLLQTAFELGIKSFDTAPIYGFGNSEARIGKAFRGSREKVSLISKCGVTWHSNRRVNMTNDPKTSLSMLEQSLKDLESEYIDLYMVHWPDPHIDIRRTLEVLFKEKEKGKILNVGLCNTNESELVKAKEVGEISYVQSEFSLNNREVSRNLFPYLNQNGIPFMSWGTLDKGILTGRVTKNRSYDKVDARSWAPWWKSQDLDQKLNRYKIIDGLARESGFSPLELAIGHNLRYKPLTHVIVGAKNLDQLGSLISSLAHLPDSDIVDELVNLLEK